MRAPAGARMFAAFRTRDYRFLWPADLATSWAFEMEMLILGWHVLVTTDSVLWLTVLGALHYLGTLLAPGVGVLGDRIGLRNLLCVMRAAYVVLAGTLTVLFLTDSATLPLVFLIAAGLGAVRPSDIGVRNALVAQIVPARRLSAALALSRTTSDSARIAGALSGAGLFAAFGIGPAYVLVTSCYVIGLALTLAVTPPVRAAPVLRRSPLRDLLEGLAYVWRAPHILGAMMLACLVNFTAFPLSIGLLPYVAKNIYGLDQTGLGLLVASFAFGALIGSIVLAAIRTRIASGRVMLITAAVWHACLIAFAFTTSNVVGMALLIVAGFAQSLSMITLALMLLRTTEAYIRGRVMGVRMLAIYSLPLGLLLMGTLIPRIGYIASAAGFAAVGLAVTVWIAWYWRESMWVRSAVANR